MSEDRVIPILLKRLREADALNDRLHKVTQDQQEQINTLTNMCIDLFNKLEQKGLDNE